MLKIEPMDYTPSAPAQAPAAKPDYELVKEVTGEGPIKRGPQVIGDLKGNKLKVPYPPKKKCKHCYGRGYVGTDAINGGLMVCRKCYPLR